MYRHILIPTDGSELAEHAVTNGLSLAKSVEPKNLRDYRRGTVRLVQRFRNESAAGFGELAEQCRADQEARCERVELRGCNAAKQAGVSCDTI